jgi:hypothetical protein
MTSGKKRHFLVMDRDGRASSQGLDIDGQHIDFHGKPAKMITDPGVADAIEQKYGLSAPKNTLEGGMVWTERDEHADHNINYHPDPVHKYFFAPTKKFAEGWERIFGRKDGENEAPQTTPPSLSS